MQFMVFMIPAVYQPKNGKPQPGPDFKPDPKMMAEMGKFNDELKKAGALLSLNGLQPLASGVARARIFEEVGPRLFAFEHSGRAGFVRDDIGPE